MPRPKTGLAFVGCGYVADLYARSLPLHPDLELVGVWDHRPERLATFTAHHELRAYSGLDELLSDPDVSVVLNLTNPHAHYEISRAALEAGKHVYSEKPLATRMDEARALVALAEARGLWVVSAPCSALGETAQTLADCLRREMAGPVRVVYAELDDDMVPIAPYGKWWSESGAPWPWKDEFEVGCTMEHAGYYLTWLALFFGPARRVVAYGRTCMPDKGTDRPLEREAPDLTVACVEFASGVAARLTCSIIAPHDHRLRIIGQRGVLSVDQSWNNLAPVRFRRWATFRRRLLLLPRRKVPLLRRDDVPRGVRRHHGMDFLLGVEDLVRAVDDDRSPRLSPAFCLHVTEMVLAIHGASRSPGVHELTTTFDPIEPMPWARPRSMPSAGASVMSNRTPSPESAVRWGILGTGRIANDFARGLVHAEGAALATVGSRSDESAWRFAHRHGLSSAHPSYEQLVADPGVDVVYVATPHHRHVDDCRMALEAGKAVLCEKPLATSAAEAREIAELARARGLFCMEAMWMRFIPLVQEVLEMVRRGDIGRPRMLAADFGYPEPFRPDSRLYSAELGGGALLDRGVYPLSLAHALFGAPATVDSHAVFAPTGVDEEVHVTLTFPGGECASLSAMLNCYGTNEAVIIGTEGRIRIHEPMCRPEAMSVDRWSAAPLEGPLDLQAAIRRRLKENRLVRGARRKLSTLLGRSGQRSIPFRGNGLTHEAEEVVRCLREQRAESQTMPLEESIRVLETVDRVRATWSR